MDDALPSVGLTRRFLARCEHYLVRRPCRTSSPIRIPDDVAAPMTRQRIANAGSAKRFHRPARDVGSVRVPDSRIHPGSPVLLYTGCRRAIRPAFAVALAFAGACSDSPAGEYYAPTEPTPVTQAADCDPKRVRLVDWWHERVPGGPGSDVDFVPWNALFAVSSDTKAPCHYEVFAKYVVRQRGRVVTRSEIGGSRANLHWDRHEDWLCVESCGPGLLPHPDSYEIEISWLACRAGVCTVWDVDDP